MIFSREKAQNLDTDFALIQVFFVVFSKFGIRHSLFVITSIF
jgi:hypothetical protein